MKNLFEWLGRNRLHVAAIMAIVSFANSCRFWGEWNEFYSVLVVQFLFGQGFVSYIGGKEINVAPGAGVKVGAPPVLRAFVGWGVFFVYILMFRFSGYE